MLRNNAREFQEKKAECKKYNGENLVANFKAIINNFRYGTPIPQEQIFDPERDD